MRIKENSFIMAIVLLPFILLLGIMKLCGLLGENLYTYLLLIMILVFSICFVASLFFALDDIIHSDNKKRIILLILVPFLYLPIYYTKYEYENEKYLGFGLAIANIMLIVSLFAVAKEYTYNKVFEIYQSNIKIKDTYSYVDKNQLFSIDVNNSFVCNNNLGDYVIACENQEDDSFIGVYN